MAFVTVESPLLWPAFRGACFGDLLLKAEAGVAVCALPFALGFVWVLVVL